MRKASNKQKKRMTHRSNRSRSLGGFSVRRETSDGPAYAGQVSWRVRIPASTTKLTTTVTSGIVAQAVSIQASDILGFNARFQSTFDEYRIVGADVEIIPLAVSSGSMNFWFDEKSTATPTQNEAVERTCVHLPINSSDSRSHRFMRWRARDLLDLQYTAIGTLTVKPVTFKAYTDNTLFGASIIATDVYLVKPVLLFEFRGLQSN